MVGTVILSDGKPLLVLGDLVRSSDFNASSPTTEMKRVLGVVLIEICIGKCKVLE